MNHLSAEQQTLLILLRQSLWQESSPLPDRIDWMAVDVMARQQAVVSMAYDGAVSLKAELPPEIKQKWNQRTMGGVIRNEQLLMAQDQVLGWLDQEKIPAAILKGSSVSRYYPQPDLRVLGDIDILIPRDKVERIREILVCNGYTFHESDHEFHLGFSKPGAYVEIHYDVTTLPNSQGGEMIRNEIAKFLENRDRACLMGHDFPVLCQNYQALSLLLHMVRHMTEGGIGLRQLCDWALYVSNTDPEYFAEVTAPMLERCGLLRYAQVATWTCVRWIGLPEQYALWCVNVTDENAQAFVLDIFRGGNMGNADSEKMGRALSRSVARGEKQSFIKMVLASLTELAYRNFPVAKKYKILLPFYWIYLPVRYWVRSIWGLREKKSLTEAAKNAKTQQDFYNMLGIYSTDEQ